MRRSLLWTLILSFQERTVRPSPCIKSTLKRVSSEICLHNLSPVEPRVALTNDYRMNSLEISHVSRIQHIKSKSMSTPLCTCTKRNNIPINDDRQIPAEKSSMILVTIVLLFIVTHSYRLALKLYEVLNPDKNTYENFQKCYAIGR